MQGLMMDYPLTTGAILERGRTIFPGQEIITRLSGGARHCYTFAEFGERVGRLMDALRRQGVQPGDRVATYCWNHYQHLELYFAVSSMGAVLHTLNIRLSDEQLAYIINHAEDRLIFADASLLEQLERVQRDCPQVRGFVVIGDEEPNTSLRGAQGYEALLASGEALSDLPVLDENSAAAMCYTSGTTGNPKGVVYSHRSIYLHTMGITVADNMGMRQADTAMPFVPMFHANAWGLPYAAIMCGARLVLPGPNPQPADVAQLLADEKVTLAAGVPTIWNMLYQHLKANPELDVSSVHTLAVGGSAAPRAMIDNYQQQYGITILHLWGMTEMSPLGTVARLKGHMLQWDHERQLDVRMKQGFPVAGVEIRARDDAGSLVPWDGETIGELEVRGPWVARGYYNNAEAGAAFTDDGWFRTGDMVTIDPQGYMQIADRSKDLIKSGGEWISSVDMENLLMAHDKVLEACVVARPDEKWDERPVACVVAADPASPPSVGELTAHLLTEFAKWQLPYEGDFHFIESVPKTSVGKFDKKVLRAWLLEQDG